LSRRSRSPEASVQKQRGERWGAVPSPPKVLSRAKSTLRCMFLSLRPAWEVRCVWAALVSTGARLALLRRGRRCAQVHTIRMMSEIRDMDSKRSALLVGMSQQEQKVTQKGKEKKGHNGIVCDSLPVCLRFFQGKIDLGPGHGMVRHQELHA
jgi:hypothetical protein